MPADLFSFFDIIFFRKKMDLHVMDPVLILVVRISSRCFVFWIVCDVFCWLIVVWTYNRAYIGADWL